MNTAVYLLNRSPTRALSNQTPFEAWHGRKPELSHLRRFGCDAYLHIPDALRSKLDSKTRRCTLLGYVHNTGKLWRLWDVRRQRVVNGASVRFDEGGFGGRIPQETPTLLEDILEEPLAVEDDERHRGGPGGPPGGGTPPESMHTAPRSSADVDDTSGGRLMAADDVLALPEIGSEETETGRQALPAPGGDASAVLWDAERVPSQIPRRSQRIQARQPPRASHCMASRASAREEPQTLTEALERDPVEWQRAIEDELQSHIENGTWEPAQLPPGRDAISSKWVFKTKVNADGTLRHKARLVVRGFQQREGLDYQETFAPVAKFTTVRVLLALAAHFDWEVHQIMMDVKTAFLYPKLRESVYMAPPEGYEEFMPSLPHPLPTMLRLLKSLYGLKQAPFVWYTEIDAFLRSFGLTRSNQDHNLYISPTLIVLLYVDDILIIAASIPEISSFKEHLSGRYSMVDLGEIQQYLGMQIDQDRGSRQLFLHQARYTETILHRFGMGDCKGVQTPMESKVFLAPPEDPSEIVDQSGYQAMVGSIMYAMLGTRPDLAYTISALSRFNSGPITGHHSAAKRALRYLQQTKRFGILYGSSQGTSRGFPEPVCYTDSDWAGDRQDRRSTGGYVFTLCGGVVSWKTRKQEAVALSTTEAEYMALSDAVKEAIWLQRLLKELENREVQNSNPDLRIYHEDETSKQWELPDPDNSLGTGIAIESTSAASASQPQKILADNQGAIKLATNPQFHDCTKHIDIRYHFVREAIGNGLITLEYVPTADMRADIMTKALPRERHWEHMYGVGMQERPGYQP